MEGDPVRVRERLRPGDIGRIVELHGRIYAEEYGWNVVFEAHVAEGLARFALDADPARDRIWVAESGERFLGSIAIVHTDEGDAQLRWFLLHADARGRGLGRRLLAVALDFCRDAGYPAVVLWTAAELTTAGRLYRDAGFRMVEEHRTGNWGATATRQRYELRLDAG